jgi:hypothetical protein
MLSPERFIILTVAKNRSSISELVIGILNNGSSLILNHHRQFRKLVDF